MPVGSPFLGDGAGSELQYYAVCSGTPVLGTRACVRIRRPGGGQGRPFGYGSGALGRSSSCWLKGELEKDMYDVLG